jgi:hypothetical protein
MEERDARGAFCRDREGVEKMGARRTAGCLVLLFATAASGAPRIVEHDVRAVVEPYRSRLTATDRMTVVGCDQSLLRFLLHKDLEITSLALAGKELRWRQAPVDPARWGGEENIEGASWDAAREVEVSIPAGSPDSLRISVAYKGTVLDSLHEPKEAYDRSFQTTNGLIEERGAFLAGSTVWVPTVPGDRFTFRLEAVVPLGWESVSQGALLSRFEEGGARVSRWVAESPMEEIYLVAGPYTFREVDLNTIKIQTFLYEAEDAIELHDRYVTAARNFLGRYERDIGPYAHPKFALVENFWQTGFGMPSFTLLGTQVIRLPFIPKTSFGHEILHDWWGNGVYVDWEQGNWCEGLTAYGADYAYKADAGPAEAAAYRRGELQKYRNYVSGAEDFPLALFRSRSDASTQAIGYSKGMLLFHMLRREIGDGSFREGLRRFYRDRLFLSSTWDDLRKAFEAASGENLSGFFAQWVERPGAPLLALEGVKATSGGEGRYQVEGTVVQEAPPFALDVPVRVETEAGTESLVVFLTEESKSFVWKGSSRPLAVSADPGFDLFRRLHREEIPPALSATLGADSVWVVLPPEGSSPEDAALDSLARTWASRPGIRITRVALPEEVFAKSAVWLLGNTVYNDRFLQGLPAGAGRAEAGWTTPTGTFPAEGHSVVLTTRHPENPDLSWSLFAPGSADVVPAIGRKIPHYGKYGYLVFRGADNVDKGEWGAGESPLKVKIAW